MKKKFIASMFVVTAVSAGFWACGEGNINPSNGIVELELSQHMDTNGLNTIRDEALQTCKNDTSFAGCYMRYKAYFDGGQTTEDPVINSSDDSGSGQNPPPIHSSSSRGDIFIVTNPSSSSVLVFDPDPESSSSGMDIVPVTGLGSCKAATNPLHKGQSTAWKFTPNQELTTGPNAKYTAMAFASQADYKWNFGGLADDGSGVRATSGKVTYTNSGVANASVTVTMPDGASEVINCAPLQVNGDTITGCKCAPVGVTGSVNFLETPDVSWTVSGCTSASDITSYTWEGAAGEATFTKTFTAETKSYAPTLKVGNADKTVIDVTCEAVKVTEGAEYTIKAPNDAGTIKLPAGSSLVVLAADGYNNTFFCKVERSDSPTGALTVTVNEESLGGGDYVALKLTKTQLKSGTSLSVTLDYPATCGIQ